MASQITSVIQGDSEGDIDIQKSKDYPRPPTFGSQLFPYFAHVQYNDSLAIISNCLSDFTGI